MARGTSGSVQGGRTQLLPGSQEVLPSSSFVPKEHLARLDPVQPFSLGSPGEPAHQMGQHSLPRGRRTDLLEMTEPTVRREHGWSPRTAGKLPGGSGLSQLESLHGLLEDI